MGNLVEVFVSYNTAVYSDKDGFHGYTLLLVYIKAILVAVHFRFLTDEDPHGRNVLHPASRLH